MNEDRILAIGLLLMIFGASFALIFVVLDLFIPIFLYPTVATLAIACVGVLVVLPVILPNPFSALRELWLVAKGEKRENDTS
jgi:hypothetical protein